MPISADNKHLYATANEGLDLGEIARCLGAITEDIGQLCGDYAVVHDETTDTDSVVPVNRINPWAKYKPVRDSGTSGIHQRMMITHFGFGSDSNDSFPPYANTVQGLINFYENNGNAVLGSVRANGWRYMRPRGGKNTALNPTNNDEGFRPFDFLKLTTVDGKIVPDTSSVNNGYDATAVSPFGTFVLSSNTFARRGGLLSGGQRRTLPQGDIEDTKIVLGDFNSVLPTTSKFNYYGLVMIALDGNGTFADRPAIMIVNTDKTIYDNMQYRGHEQMTLGYTLSANAFEARNYKVYPFLTNRQFESDLITYGRTATISSARLYPIPGAEPKQISIYDFQIEITVYALPAQAVGGGYSTSIFFTIKNNYNTAVTINDLMLKIRKAGKDYSEARTAGEIFYSASRVWSDTYPTDSGHSSSEYAQVLGSVTIGSGETVRIPLQSGQASADDFTVNMPSSDVNNVFIGCTFLDTPNYGYARIVMPASNELNDLQSNP